MSDIDCTADLDHPCDADDGEPCPRCVQQLADDDAYFRGQWAKTSPAERDAKRYEQDMKDAGRGHLVSAQAWSMFQRQQGEK